jgi:hypothetical protein
VFISIITTTDARFWEWLDSEDISLMPSLIFSFWNKGVNYAEGRAEESYGVIDTSSLDTMIDSLADINSRMPMIKQLRGPYDAPGMWRDDLLCMAKIMDPDFMVYIGRWIPEQLGSINCSSATANARAFPRCFSSQMHSTTGLLPGSTA